jgi:hypothetical protein
VIQPERDAYREAQTAVFPGSRHAEQAVVNGSRAVLASALAVLEVHERHGVILPLEFRRVPDVMCPPIRVDQLYVADVKAQICKEDALTGAIDRLTVPRCHDRNFDG